MVLHQVARHTIDLRGQKGVQSEYRPVRKEMWVNSTWSSRQGKLVDNWCTVSNHLLFILRCKRHPIQTKECSSFGMRHVACADWSLASTARPSRTAAKGVSQSLFGGIAFQNYFGAFSSASKPFEAKPPGA
eukprot:1157536-Pelagomonas_calceolata.AAC.6